MLEKTPAPDAVTLEVLRNKFDGIANEMQLSLLKSAFSPVVKETMDCSAALFTPDGETLAQATAIPFHLSIQIFSLAALLQEFPVETMRPGDIYVVNDPYVGGGSHLPDITICTPVFIDGVLLAYSVTTVHHQDVGGSVPGSMPTNATEIFQEGFRIPPLKLFDEGVRNDTFMKLLALNSRLPRDVIGDLNAQLAAGAVGERRLRDLAASYGFSTVAECIRILLDKSEMMTRAALLKAPQGTFHAVEFMDNDGISLDKRVRLEVSVTVKGGTFHVDLTGTEPQVQGPLNCVPSGAYAAAYYALRVVTGADIPTNGGCFRPVSLTLPVGSLVNPLPPAPVGARSSAVKRITGAILSAWAGGNSGQVPADSARVVAMVACGGKRPSGDYFIVTEFVAGGSGASAYSDGTDCIQTDVTNSMNLPVEALALEAPVRVNRLALRKDSGGDGKFRGGLGVEKEYEFLADNLRLTYRAERHFAGAAGAQGGKNGAKARATIHRADGSEEEIQSKCVTTVNCGDRLVIETAGGGGYGLPEQRSDELRRIDFLNGKTSSPSYQAQGEQVGSTN